MTHFTKSVKKMATITAAAALLCTAAGCSATDIENAPSSWTSIYSSDTSSGESSSSDAPTDTSSSEESGSSSTDTESSSESSSSSESGASTSSSESSASSVPESDPVPVPGSANIKIRSVSQSLANYDEIANKSPQGSPEEVVKTLLERNVICFAAMQGVGWEKATENYSGTLAPISSDCFKSAEQISDLFYSTYTGNQAWRLLHPQEVNGFGDVFQDTESGLCFDMSHLRRYHMESFETETYAGIIDATEDEITFGRYYESNPSGNSAEPNNMLFKVVKEEGEWLLENYITDAPAYAEENINFVTGARKGNPELMELAKKQVGNIGGKLYWDWYGFEQHMEWCGAFVSWCYSQAGKNGPFFTACNSEGKYWFETNGQWGWKDYKDIAPADSIFFDWDLDGSADHVGLVLGTDGEYVYTIEGNRDDVCISRAYPLSYAYILGYGLMEWD